MIDHPLSSDPAWMTMRRIIEAREHEISVLTKMVAGRDKDIQRLRAELLDTLSRETTLVSRQNKMHFEIDRLRSRLAEADRKNALAETENEELRAEIERLRYLLREWRTTYSDFGAPNELERRTDADLERLP